MRRITLDVDADGTLVGGAVEHYPDDDSGRYALQVAPIGWADTHTPESGLADLLANGWLQQPLPFPARMASRPHGADGDPLPVSWLPTVP